MVVVLLHFFLPKSVILHYALSSHETRTDFTWCFSYSETLKGRANLLTETDALRTQNAELRMLLHQYINSKVNAELEIPPTRVLQLDVGQQWGLSYRPYPRFRCGRILVCMDSFLFVKPHKVLVQSVESVLLLWLYCGIRILSGLLTQEMVCTRKSPYTVLRDLECGL